MKEEGGATGGEKKMISTKPAVQRKNDRLDQALEAQPGGGQPAQQQPEKQQQQGQQQQNQNKRVYAPLSFLLILIFRFMSFFLFSC